MRVYFNLIVRENLDLVINCYKGVIVILFCKILVVEIRSVVGLLEIIGLVGKVDIKVVFLFYGEK